MMKLNIGSIIIAASLINLSACSYVKGLFPDKEKDYQFTTEIKPLVIPRDLSGSPILKQSETPAASANESGKTAAMQVNSIPDADTGAVEQGEASVDNSANAGASLETESTAVEQVQPESVAPIAEQEPEVSEITEETSASVQQPAKQKTQKTDEIPVKLVVYDDGESRLRIGADTLKSWRMVGKALSRKSIEVISRSQEEASYEVQYDPDEQKVEDGSLWDEAVFMFGGFDTNEKRYILKLLGNNQQTDVAVLEQDEKPAMNGAGLRLLKLIQKTLKEDQSD